MKCGNGVSLANLLGFQKSCQKVLLRFVSKIICFPIKHDDIPQFMYVVIDVLHDLLSVSSDLVGIVGFIFHFVTPVCLGASCVESLFASNSRKVRIPAKSMIEQICRSCKIMNMVFFESIPGVGVVAVNPNESCNFMHVILNGGIAVIDKDS